MPRVRIKLASIDLKKLNEVCETIKQIATSAGIVIRGPIPLPTKRLRITTRRAPDGEGSETWDHFEMRIHKRLIDLPMEEKVLRQIIRLHIPKDVNIEIQMID